MEGNTDVRHCSKDAMPSICSIILAELAYVLMHISGLNTKPIILTQDGRPSSVLFLKIQDISVSAWLIAPMGELCIFFGSLSFGVSQQNISEPHSLQPKQIKKTAADQNKNKKHCKHIHVKMERHSV